MLGFAEANQAPTAVGTIPALTMNAGDSATVNVSHYFWDPDGDTLTYSATSSNISVATVSVSASTATIQRVALGTATITVTANDPGALTATQTFAVTVVNRAPTTVGSIGVPPLNVGSGLVSVTIGADSHFSDPDGDALTYTASSSDTSVATFKWYGTSLSISAAGAGTATITVTATDPGGLTATQSVSVTVSGGSNTAPTAVGSIPAQTLSVGDTDVTVHFDGYFSDPDGDVLLYGATSSNSAVVSVSVSASMATLSAVATGTATITATATDPGGLTATQSISVTVNAASNRAPTTVGTIPSQTLTVGGSDATVQLSSYFSDPDGDVLLYGATSSNSAVVSVSVSASMATLSAVATGTATITATATDPGGLTATQSISVTVNAASNRAPTTVGTIPSQTLTVGGSDATVQLSSYFSDPDGDVLLYGATSSNSTVVSVSVSASMATLSAVGMGTATIIATVTDPGGLTATQSISVTVNAASNRAPVVVLAIQVHTLQLNDSHGIAVQSYFSDPDGDTLTYSASSSDTGVATFRWTDTSLTFLSVAAGTATITITATDPGGLTATQNVSITVSAGSNTAPTTVGTIPAQTLTVGGSDATVQLSGYFSDPDGDVLLYGATSSSSAVVSVSVSASMATLSAVATGTATITATVTDPGGLTATQSISVTVNAASNRAPTAVGTIPSQTVPVDGGDATFELSGYFSDPDGDSLLYSGTSSNSAIATVAVSASIATITPVATGAATITVTVTDPGGLTATQSVSVTVSAGSNTPPSVVGTIPALTMDAGDTATVVASHYFWDPDGDTLTYSATSSNDAVATVSLSASKATIRRVAMGTATITVTASDPGALTATQTFAVTVENRAPTAVGSIGVPPLNVGSGLVSVTIGADSHFSDPDGDALTYTASSSDTSVATFKWYGTSMSISAAGAGTATITVTATDPGGLTATQSVSVTVSAGSNTAPTAVGSIPAQTSSVGDTDVTVHFDGYFSDPDGDLLLYSATSSNSAVASVMVSASMAIITPVGAGTATITVTATDPSNLTATQTISVTVSAGSNTAPKTVGTIPAQTLTVGGSDVTVQLSGYFSDPDGDTLTYSATSLNSAVVSVSVSGSMATLSAVGAGTTAISVTATDPGGLTSTSAQGILVTVNAGSNTAPKTVGTIPSQTLTVGGSDVTVQLSGYFTDPDGDTLTYNATSLNSAVVSVSVSGSVATLSAVATGTATITATVTDPGGLTATQSISVTVNAASNRAPTAVGTIPARTVPVGGGDATFELSGYFSDPDGDSLLYSGTSSNSAIATVAVLASIATITPVATGAATITVTVTDPGGLTATQSVSVTVSAGSNTPPSAVGTIPALTMDAGDTATVVASHYFWDPDGDTLTYSATSSNDAVATVSLSASKATIRRVALGTATITVTANDPGALTATQTFAVTVENRAPTAVGSIGVPPLNVGSGLVSVTIGADSHFSDPDGDALTYTASSSDTSVATFKWYGTSMSISAAGAGTATITVTATDPGGLTATQSVSVTVSAGSNTAPTAVGTIPAQTVPVGDSTTTVQLDSYFSDPDGDILLYSAASSNSAIATVAVSASMVTITPVTVGTATITVTATDPGNLFATQTFSVSVTLKATPNRAPVAVGTIPAQTLSVGDSDVTVHFDGYFSDPDGDLLLFSATSSSSAVATVMVSASMAITTPVGAGTATITVTATDPGNLTATQTISVTVNATPNRAPVAVGSIPAQTLSVGDSDVTVHFDGYFSDPDGDILLYGATSSNSAVATVAVSASMAIITPVGAGTATITVTATDPGNLTATQTISVTVNATPNRAPVAVGSIPAQTLSVGDSDVTVHFDGYFSDPDGDILLYSATSSNSAIATVAVSASMAIITPVGAGTATITVTTTDPGNLTATQTISVTVSASSNRAPVLVGKLGPTLQLDDRTAYATIDVSPYFSDPDGDILTFSATSSNEFVVKVSMLSSIATVTPVTTGNATITITASDGELTAARSVSVTVVAGSNRPPVAVGKIPARTISIGGNAITVDISGYFNDPDGDTLTYAAASSYDRVATVRVSSATGDAIRITPAAEAGTTTITVTAADSGGLTAIQNFAVTIDQQLNRSPLIVDYIPAQTLTVGGSAVTIDASGYFSDPDGDELSYKASPSPTGVVTVSVSGATLTITPSAAGTTTINVTANDGSVNASMPFSVRVPNRAPVATGTIRAVTVKVGGSATVYVGNSFSDPDGDTLTYTAASSDAAKAVVTVAGSTVLIAPLAAGTTTITVTATDPGGLAAIQTFSVSVSGGPNRAPVAVGTIPVQTLSHGGNAATVDLSGYFSDPDGDKLTYTAVSSDTSKVNASVSNATLTIAISTVTAAGQTTVTVTASDPGGLTATQSVSVTVNPVVDLNNDGVVNILDLVLVASQLGQTGATKADVNGDGIVNVLDITLIASMVEGASAAPAAGALTAQHIQSWLNKATDLIQSPSLSREFSYEQGIVSLEQILTRLLPESTALLANYPNPFNPETWMPYRLSEPSEVTLTVYSLTGEVIRRFALGHQSTGVYQSRGRAVYWDGANESGDAVASGIYFYTLTAGDFSATRKMLIRK